MPWRDSPTPYSVWVSEIMLQQTQVETVRPYFERFMKKFPTVHALADAKESDVLKAWEGLGYYSRARNLHRAAQEVSRERNGIIPETFEALLRLPGIGRYSAGAIASIAFHQPVPAVDGNVLRVMARFRGIREEVRKPQVFRGIEAYLKARVPRDRPGDFNQALMELGALVCRPRDPACGICPLARVCVARRKNLASRLPVRAPVKSVPHRELVAAIVMRRGRVLICRRGTTGLLGGLWEFPGGRVARGESLQESVERLCEETAGIRVRCAGTMLGAVDHAYSHFKITLRAFRATGSAGRACAAKPYSELKWVAPGDLDAYAFHNASRKIARMVFPG